LTKQKTKIMGFFSNLKSAMGGNKEQIQEMIQNGAIVLDVRSVGEFNTGHVKGSKNIPVDQLGPKVNSFKGKKVVVVCKSGGRAMQAKSMLEREGIEAVNAGAWQNVG
jgi:rhodanese-related sulfurtransferase